MGPLCCYKSFVMSPIVTPLIWAIFQIFIYLFIDFFYLLFYGPQKPYSLFYITTPFLFMLKVTILTPKGQDFFFLFEFFLYTISLVVNFLKGVVQIYGSSFFFLRI